MSFGGDYNSLLNRPNIEEGEERRFIVVDNSGNIIAEID
jgi:hypothetical protein